MNWRVGVASGACVDCSILDVLPVLKHAGARGIEIGTPPRHFRPAAADEVERVRDCLGEVGLEAVSIHAPFGRSLDLASPSPEEREGAIAAIVSAAAAIHRLGGRIVVIHPSDLERADHNVDARLSDCLASLMSLLDRTRSLDVTIAVESPLPHLIGGHPDELQWLLGRLNRSVSVCLDTGHAALGRHWHRLLDVADGRLIHVHASDNHGTRDDHLPPGDGRIDWHDIARTLTAVNFRGWIMLELHCAPEDPRAYFTRAIAQAKRLLPTVND